MSNIAIIDADIVGKKKHRFPNLCCMKISAYHKKLGDTVVMLISKLLDMSNLVISFFSNNNLIILFLLVSFILL